MYYYYRLQQVRQASPPLLLFLSCGTFVIDRLLVKFSPPPYDKDDPVYMLNLIKEIEGEEIRNRLVASDAGSSIACSRRWGRE